jgi:hypothetical protein
VSTHAHSLARSLALARARAHTHTHTQTVPRISQRLLVLIVVPPIRESLPPSLPPALPLSPFAESCTHLQKFLSFNLQMVCVCASLRPCVCTCACAHRYPQLVGNQACGATISPNLADSDLRCHYPSVCVCKRVRLWKYLCLHACECLSVYARPHACMSVPVSSFGLCAERIRSIALSVSLRFLHILRYLNATVCLCVCLHARAPVARLQRHKCTTGSP